MVEEELDEYLVLLRSCIDTCVYNGGNLFELWFVAGGSPHLSLAIVEVHAWQNNTGAGVDSHRHPTVQIGRLHPPLRQL